MNREKVFVKEVLAEGERRFTLEYYLTEDDVCPEGGFGMCMYGVEVVKLEASCAESAYADSLCSDKTEVMEFLKVISNAHVTPVTLFDVVYDRMAAMHEQDESVDFVFSAQAV